jgi:hypothetical protein
MYALCVGQKWVSPGEFWAMAPGEVWWLIDAMMPKGGAGLAADDLDEMYEALMAAKAEEVANG